MDAALFPAKIDHLQFHLLLALVTAKLNKGEIKMSKTRWIILLVVICVFALGPITEASQERDSKPAAQAQAAEVDWCCVSGLPCCIIPPER